MKLLPSPFISFLHTLSLTNTHSPAGWISGGSSFTGDQHTLSRQVYFIVKWIKFCFKIFSFLFEITHWWGYEQCFVSVKGFVLVGNGTNDDDDVVFPLHSSLEHRSPLPHRPIPPGSPHHRHHSLSNWIQCLLYICGEGKLFSL